MYMYVWVYIVHVHVVILIWVWNSVFSICSILELLWQDVTVMLHREYEGISHKTVNIPLFARLKDLAVTLSDFFEADGNGLSRRQMETQPYMVWTTLRSTPVVTPVVFIMLANIWSIILSHFVSTVHWFFGYNSSILNTTMWQPLIIL